MSSPLKEAAEAPMKENTYETDQETYGCIDLFDERKANENEVAKVFLVDKDQITLGRDGKNDIRLNNLRVSRLQCQLEIEKDGNDIVVNLISKNQRKTTLVSGKELGPNEKIQIKNGEIIKIVDFTLRWRLFDKQNPTGQITFQTKEGQTKTPAVIRLSNGKTQSPVKSPARSKSPCKSPKKATTRRKPSNDMRKAVLQNQMRKSLSEMKKEKSDDSKSKDESLGAVQEEEEESDLNSSTSSKSSDLVKFDSSSKLDESKDSEEKDAAVVDLEDESMYFSISETSKIEDNKQEETSKKKGILVVDLDDDDDEEEEKEESIDLIKLDLSSTINKSKELESDLINFSMASDTKINDLDTQLIQPEDKNESSQTNKVSVNEKSDDFEPNDNEINIVLNSPAKSETGSELNSIYEEMALLHNENPTELNVSNIGKSTPKKANANETVDIPEDFFDDDEDEVQVISSEKFDKREESSEEKTMLEQKIEDRTSNDGGFLTDMKSQNLIDSITISSPSVEANKSNNQFNKSADDDDNDEVEKKEETIDLIKLDLSSTINKNTQLIQPEDKNESSQINEVSVNKKSDDSEPKDNEINIELNSPAKSETGSELNSIYEEMALLHNENPTELNVLNMAGKSTPKKANANETVDIPEDFFEVEDDEVHVISSEKFDKREDSSEEKSMLEQTIEEKTSNDEGFLTDMKSLNESTLNSSLNKKLKPPVEFSPKVSDVGEENELTDASMMVVNLEPEENETQKKDNLIDSITFFEEGNEFEDASMFNLEPEESETQKENLIDSITISSPSVEANKSNSHLLINKSADDDDDDDEEESINLIKDLSSSTINKNNKLIQPEDKNESSQINEISVNEKSDDFEQNDNEINIELNSPAKSETGSELNSIYEDIALLHNENSAELNVSNMASKSTPKKANANETVDIPQDFFEVEDDEVQVISSEKFDKREDSSEVKTMLEQKIEDKTSNDGGFITDMKSLKEKALNSSLKVFVKKLKPPVEFSPRVSDVGVGEENELTDASMMVNFEPEENETQERENLIDSITISSISLEANKSNNHFVLINKSADDDHKDTESEEEEVLINNSADENYKETEGEEEEVLINKSADDDHKDTESEEVLINKSADDVHKDTESEEEVLINNSADDNYKKTESEEEDTPVKKTAATSGRKTMEKKEPETAKIFPNKPTSFGGTTRNQRGNKSESTQKKKVEESVKESIKPSTSKMNEKSESEEEEEEEKEDTGTRKNTKGRKKATNPLPKALTVSITRMTRNQKEKVESEIEDEKSTQKKKVVSKESSSSEEEEIVERTPPKKPAKMGRKRKSEEEVEEKIPSPKKSAVSTRTTRRNLRTNNKIKDDVEDDKPTTNKKVYVVGGSKAGSTSTMKKDKSESDNEEEIVAPDKKIAVTRGRKKLESKEPETEKIFPNKPTATGRTTRNQRGNNPESESTQKKKVEESVKESIKPSTSKKNEKSESEGEEEEDTTRKNTKGRKKATKPLPKTLTVSITRMTRNQKEKEKVESEIEDEKSTQKKKVVSKESSSSEEEEIVERTPPKKPAKRGRKRKLEEEVEEKIPSPKKSAISTRTTRRNLRTNNKIKDDVEDDKPTPNKKVYVVGGSKAGSTSTMKKDKSESDNEEEEIVAPVKKIAVTRGRKKLESKEPETAKIFPNKPTASGRNTRNQRENKPEPEDSSSESEIEKSTEKKKVAKEIIKPSSSKKNKKSESEEEEEEDTTRKNTRGRKKATKPLPKTLAVSITRMTRNQKEKEKVESGIEDEKSTRKKKVVSKESSSSEEEEIVERTAKRGRKMKLEEKVEKFSSPKKAAVSTRTTRSTRKNLRAIKMM